MRKIANTKFSKTAAHIHLAIVGIFYLVSGFWEILWGRGELGLSDFHRNYSVSVGVITIFIGFGLLVRVRSLRYLAIILALWFSHLLLSGETAKYVYVVVFLMFFIFAGVGFFVKLNFVRLLALVLAWWNLFAIPLGCVWYAISVHDPKSTVSWFGFWVEVMIFPSISIFIRLYIIYILKPQRAGYLFLKDEGGRTNV